MTTPLKDVLSIALSAKDDRLAEAMSLFRQHGRFAHA